MAIEKKELTKEQKKAIGQLYKKFLMGGFIAAILYCWFMFFGILAIVIFNKLYMNSQEFQAFCCFGTAFIAVNGLFATLQERREELSANILEIVKK